MTDDRIDKLYAGRPDARLAYSTFAEHIKVLARGMSKAADQDQFWREMLVLYLGCVATALGADRMLEMLDDVRTRMNIDSEVRRQVSDQLDLLRRNEMN